MMKFMERKALYNSLRITFREDPTLRVYPWQVEDYRKLSTEELFADLQQMGLHLDRTLFAALAEEVDSPEDLTMHLISDEQESPEAFDRVYLYVFELWRRICPEKQTIALFCDELDHQIDLFDSEDRGHSEPIEDAIAQLETILEDNLEEGGNPQELFRSISEGCAHDVEGFLYDFIEGLIEHGNRTYAEELIETFTPFVLDPKWFRLLNLKTAALVDLDEAKRLMTSLVVEAEKAKDLEFNFALLDQAAQTAEKEAFFSLLKQSIPLLKTEGDFTDLLGSCEDFAHYADAEAVEKEIQTMQVDKSKISPEASLSPKDPFLERLRVLFKQF
jgi:hypothetical protein